MIQNILNQSVFKDDQDEDEYIHASTYFFYLLKAPRFKNGEYELRVGCY